ncbi:hypothetical protein STEG23_011592, partial [Scotinomys teguina]
YHSKRNEVRTDPEVKIIGRDNSQEPSRELHDLRNTPYLAHSCGLIPYKKLLEGRKTGGDIGRSSDSASITAKGAMGKGSPEEFNKKPSHPVSMSTKEDLKKIGPYCLAEAGLKLPMYLKLTQSLIFLAIIP